MRASTKLEEMDRLFHIYLGACGITDDGQKKQLLLHTVGECVQEISFILVT